MGGRETRESGEDDNHRDAKPNGQRRLTRVPGPVQQAVVDGIDVDVAGTDERIAHPTSVTIRQATGIPGWVGTVDTDLTAYADIKLELRRPGSSTDCAVLFTIGAGLKDRTLIRGTRQHLVHFE